MLQRDICDIHDFLCRVVISFTSMQPTKPVFLVGRISAGAFPLACAMECGGGKVWGILTWVIPCDHRNSLWQRKQDEVLYIFTLLFIFMVFYTILGLCTNKTDFPVSI